MRLGQRLKKLREQRGWTQTQVARAVGVSAPCISRLESGSLTDVNMALGLRMARLFGVSLDYLAGAYEDLDDIGALPPPPTPRRGRPRAVGD